MSNTTSDAGPPRDNGMLDRIRASVKAVATSPSASTYAQAVVRQRCDQHSVALPTQSRSLSVEIIAKSKQSQIFVSVKAVATPPPPQPARR